MLGLSSGIDTESLIKGLLQYDKYKLDREIQNRTLLQWKQDALTQVNTDLRDFRSKYMSVLSPDNLLTASAFNQFNVETSGEAKDAVTITAGEGATNGRVVVDYVTQLASGAKAVSSAGVSAFGDQLSDSNHTKLSQLNFTNSLGAVNGKISFSINGEVFEFSTEDTLHNMMTKINNNEKAGVTMSYSRLTDTFTIESDETGVTRSDGTINTVVIKNITGNAFGSGSAFGIATGAYSNGKNASLSIDGHEITRRSNNFTIDGITYSLNDVFNTDMTPSSGIRATVSRDIEPTIEKIKGFVTAYNELYNKLSDMVTERKTAAEKSYKPLSEEEKSLLTEEQVKEWETIAKKGLLNNEPGIQNVLNQMRATLYETVSSAGLSPADIGLRTGTWDMRGQIQLDEAMLRDALEKDSDSVMQVFTAFASESANEADAYKENGFLNRLSDIISKYSSESNTSSIQSINRIISNLDDRVELLETRMAELEERYYLKFAAMESILTQLQSQSDWIGNNMGL